MRAPFTEAELAETRRPLLEATQLPPRAYVDEAVADWEAERLFPGGWVCVGPAQPLPPPARPLATRGPSSAPAMPGGSFRFMGEAGGGAQGFFTVCRHRGARLVSEP